MRITAMRNPMGLKSYIRYNTCCTVAAQLLYPSRPLACIQYLYPMVSNTAKEVFIQGITRDGKTFRPSDWAERLAGVMSQFRPGGPQPGSHLSYSPWCIPTSVDGVKCVVVQPRPARRRAHGLGLLHQLRQGQRPADVRGLGQTRRPDGVIAQLGFAGDRLVPF